MFPVSPLPVATDQRVIGVCTVVGGAILVTSGN